LADLVLAKAIKKVNLSHLQTKLCLSVTAKRKRFNEAKRLADEKAAEKKRLEDEKAAADARAAEEKRAADAAAKAAEEKRRKDTKAAEEKAISEQLD
jgi:hypothetical protein